MHNNITHIHNQQGDYLEEHGDFEKELIKHFKSVHQEPNTNKKPTIDKILPHIPKVIRDEHNQLLLRLVTF